MDILVKVSSLLVNDEKFYRLLKEKVSQFGVAADFYILCGGGAMISQRLENAGISSKFGPRGREIESEKGRREAGIALEEIGRFVKKRLRKEKIRAIVLLPRIKINRGLFKKKKVFHFNGDYYIEASYPNFGKIFVVTKMREGIYKSFPEELTRIEVVYL